MTTPKPWRCYLCGALLAFTAPNGPANIRSNRLAALILLTTTAWLAPFVAAGEDLLTVDDFAASILVRTNAGCSDSLSTSEIPVESFSGSRQCNSTNTFGSQVLSGTGGASVSASGIFVDVTSALNLSVSEVQADSLVALSISVRFTVHQLMGYEATGFTRASASQSGQFPTTQRTQSFVDLFLAEDDFTAPRILGPSRNLILGQSSDEPTELENIINRDGVLFPGAYRMRITANLEGITPPSGASFSAQAEARVSLSMPLTLLIPCCSPNGFCNELTPVDCANSGGFPSGELSCETSECFLPTGACCIGAECTQRNEAACLNRGGTYFGDGTSCNDVDCCPEKDEECPDKRGACCLGISPEKNCEFIRRSECEERGGAFRGENVDCEETSCICDVFWAGLPTGNFGDEENWIGEQVPFDELNGCQNAVFDAATVSLSFGVQILNSLFLRGNQSQLNVSGEVMQLSGRPSIEFGARPALGIGSSTKLTIEQGAINGRNAIIGDTAGQFSARIEVQGAGASLNLVEELQIGDGANGFLDVFGGTVLSDSANIGSPAGRNGALAIFDDGSFRTGLLRLGDTGNGSISVQNGIVQAGDVRVGNGVPPAGSPNSSLTVNGENARVVATGEVLLGAIGRGDMRIENGGRVQAATLTLGGLGGDIGTALITGRADAQIASRAEVGAFNVGFESDGDITVEEGGRLVTTGSGVVGDQSFGAFRVRGVHPPTGTASTLEIGEDFIVGRNGFAVVTLSASAQSSVQRNLFIGTGSDEGILTVRDAGLTVEQESVIGDFGAGTLEVIGLGVAVLKGNTTLGREASSSGAVIIERGDSLTATPTVDFGADCRVGATGPGLLRVEVGGLARVRGVLRIGNGLVELRGQRGADPPVLEALDGITVGDGIAPGRLTLAGNAQVMSTRIVIDVAGFLNQSPGSLITGEIVNGGFITVSGSAGKQGDGPALIDGDLDMLPGGVLRVEAGGEGPALRITGSVSLAGGLEIFFPEGFEPSQGQSFEIVLAEGAIEGDFETLSAPERDGFAGTLNVVDGIVRANIDEPGTPREAEGELEGEGEPEGEGAPEGEPEGEGETEGETEGEPDPTPPGGCAGCGGCDGTGGPMEKMLGDWLATFLGLTGLLAAHLHFRRKSLA